MSEFNKEVLDITKSTTPINPNIHNLKNTMCFKTWNDLIISLPQRTVKWCCKTKLTPEQDKQVTFDLDILERDGLDFFINHPVLAQRKYDLSGGTRSPDCIGCWRSEDVSDRSVRTEYTRNFDPLWIHRLEKTDNHPKKAVQFNQELQDYDGFRFIELELTNKCNMACVYCWEGSSTRWQKETGNRMPDTDDAIFNKVIDLLNEYWEGDLGKHDYVNFSLLGGEPFFTDHMYQFLEEFVVNLNDTKRKEQVILITVTTNLNFPSHKFDKFIELVKRTPNIIYMMQLSNESVGRRSEIVRWGLNWDTWDKNLDAFFVQAKENKNLSMGFGCAHNSLSYPYFKEYLEYINEKVIQHEYTREITMHTNWVDNPEYLSVRMINPDMEYIAQEIIDYFENEFTANVRQKAKYINVLKTLKSHVLAEVDEYHKKEAYKSFEGLEKRRNISFVEHFPHYNDLIKHPHK
jgi:sulfatase maturation enzyme AslB (radical SAM superfamily)